MTFICDIKIDIIMGEPVSSFFFFVKLLNFLKVDIFWKFDIFGDFDIFWDIWTSDIFLPFWHWDHLRPSQSYFSDNLTVKDGLF